MNPFFSCRQLGNIRALMYKKGIQVFDYELCKIVQLYLPFIIKS